MWHGIFLSFQSIVGSPHFVLNLKLIWNVMEDYKVIFYFKKQTINFILQKTCSGDEHLEAVWAFF